MIDVWSWRPLPLIDGRPTADEAMRMAERRVPANLDGLDVVEFATRNPDGNFTRHTVKLRDFERPSIFLRASRGPPPRQEVVIYVARCIQLDHAVEPVDP